MSLLTSPAASSVVKLFGQFEREGFFAISSLLTDEDCNRLTAELAPLFKEQVKSSRSRIGGVRNVLQTNSLVSNLATSPPISELIRRAAGEMVFPVRAIFFDKNPKSNWLVPWHQDLAIAVAEQIEAPDFTGWSIKDGVFHVHPPAKVLDGMVAIRLHLHDCTESKGALRAIAGSHRFGKLSADKILRWTSAQEPVVCELAKGDALLMRPLLLHASPPAASPLHRRVLHIEYATKELPNGLNWHEL